MGEPWIVKKYMDEVFTIGHGRLYAAMAAAAAMRRKQSAAAACCKDASICFHSLGMRRWRLAEPDQFFNGTGVDNVYMHFHRANEFLGTEALPTFLCNDVIQAPMCRNIPPLIRRICSKCSGLQDKRYTKSKAV